MIARRLAITSGQYDGPRGATPADQANVMSLMAVGISSRLSMKMSSASCQNDSFTNTFDSSRILRHITLMPQCST